MAPPTGSGCGGSWVARGNAVAGGHVCCRQAAGWRCRLVMQAGGAVQLVVVVVVVVVVAVVEQFSWWNPIQAPCDCGDPCPAAAVQLRLCHRPSVLAFATASAASLLLQDCCFPYRGATLPYHAMLHCSKGTAELELLDVDGNWGWNQNC